MGNIDIMDMLEAGLLYRPVEYFIYKDKVDFKMVALLTCLSLSLIAFILFIIIF